MSNELTISENSGAATGPATGEGGAAGAMQEVTASIPANASRKAEIEAVMKTDFDLYESSGMAAEYRALLQAEVEAANPEAGNPTAPMPADASRTLLCGSLAGQQLVYAWERMGGFNVHLQNVQRTVGDIVRGAGNNLRQRYVMETFSKSVSVAAECALMDEIASGAPTFIPPASDAEVSMFRATPAGTQMVSEWGKDAPEKVAILRARAQRMTGYMDPDDAADFWAWFQTLETPMIVQIYRKMAG
ncbi:conserved hypothetical protein [Mesorhizobium plurifarium]|uniref:Uncharacterized protein n=1 Tax=Mesorhizobium plurifarium TaxID=69974 RepID=A0A090G770_MESPL|nr:conserved hypothetical protein [Mesorhizobium plurifarium]